MKTGSLFVVLAVLAAAAPAAQAQWVAAAPAPQARSRAAGAIIGSKFYYMGGETTGGVRNITCWALDIPANTWTPIASLPSNGVGAGGVSNIDAAVVGTKIYLIGGWTGAATTNPTLEYDSVADTWTTITSDPCPTPIHAHTCVALNGKVYVIGGATASGVLSTSAYVYDPQAPAGSRWSTIPGPVTGRQYPASTIVGGKIYLAGGIGATTANEYNTVEVYDPGTNSWSAGPNMGAARGGPAMFTRNGEAYIVAGGWSSYLTSGENLSGNAWGPSTPCNFGLRTIAHDGNSQYLVKAGGWSGAFQAFAEVMTLQSSCYPDCNGDGNLNLADFGCFQTKFALGDPYADCNGDGNLNLADFGCFQTKFALGCP